MIGSDADRQAPGRKPRHGVEWRSASAMRLHATMLAGVAGCAVATRVEWTRALGGHTVAWVYAFEWPLFAVMGVYVWWKLLHGDLAVGRHRIAEGRPLSSPPRDQAQASVRQRKTDIPSDDPGLAAWERYLERLHALDPPGGPPGEQGT